MPILQGGGGSGGGGGGSGGGGGGSLDQKVFLSWELKCVYKYCV